MTLIRGDGQDGRYEGRRQRCHSLRILDEYIRVPREKSGETGNFLEKKSLQGKIREFGENG